VISSPGVYDGLDEPKEPGDLVYTTFRTDCWYVIHEYRTSSGSLKGIYVNINTKPEVRVDGVVRYIDLYVDVVKKPGSPAEVIDIDELEKAARDGIVSKDMVSKVTRLAASLREQLESEDTPPDSLLNAMARV
jgi:predicted RNA-binding protein associated with RNAse of E/G family